MDERLINNIDAVTQGGSPSHTPVKSKKASKIIIAFLILILVAGGVVAALFFTGVIGGKKGNNPGPEGAVEVPLENQDAIKSIENKLKNLLGATKEGESLSVNSSDFDDINLINHRDLTEEEKVYRTFRSLSDTNKREISELDRETAGEVWTREGGDPALFVAENLKAFNGDAVAKQYKNLFGTDLDRLSLESARIQYAPELDFYFTVNNPVATAITRFYYPGEYSITGDIVSIYISSAQYNSEAREVFSGVALPTAGPLDLVETLPEGTTFKMDSGNAGNYPITRIDFIRTDENGYVFMGVGSTLNPENVVETEE